MPPPLLLLEHQSVRQGGKGPVEPSVGRTPSSKPPLVIASILNVFDVTVAVVPTNVATSVSPIAIWLMLRSLNVATPLLRVCANVPERVPGPVPMASVMLPPSKDVTAALFTS